MRKMILTAMVMIVAVGLGGSSVRAQGGGDGGNLVMMLRHKLEITDELIDRTEASIRTYSSPTAELALNSARHLQERAWEEFHKATLTAYRLADKLTEQAREQTKKALTNSRATERNDAVVQNHLDKAQELIDRCRDLLTGTDHHGMQALLESIRGNLSQAEEFYRRNQFKAALKLAQQVEIAAEKLIRAAMQAHQADSSFRQHYGNMRELVDRVREDVADCGSQTAEQLLERAGDILESSREMAESSQYAAALRAVQRARELAMKAGRECLNGDRLEQRYEQLVARAERLREHIGASGSTEGQQVKQLLSRAWEQLELARELIDQNKVEQAQAALQAAKLTLQQAEKQIRPGM